MKAVGKIATLGLLAGLLLRTAAATEENPGGGGEVFSDQVEVRVATVEVVVEDAEDQKIRGLSATDFEIYEEGERQEIQHFSALDRARLSGEPAAGSAATNVDAERVHLALVIDDAHLTPQNRKQVFAELNEYLATLGSNDVVLIARIDNKLTIEEPFTNDRARLAATLERLQKGPGSLPMDGEYRRILREITSASLSSTDAGGGAGDLVAMTARAQARDILAFGARRQQLVERSIAALSVAVGTLSGLRSRKALIYLGDGLAMRATESLTEAWRGRYESWAVRSGKRELLSDLGRARGLAAESQTGLDELAAKASAARVSFYALAPGGTVRSGMGSGEIVASPGAALSRNAAITETFETTGPLLRLANITGGRASTRGFNVAGLLDGAREDLGTFYSLGYKPKKDAQDGLRRLEVKVRREGARVRHTHVLAEVEPLEELRRLTLATLHHGLADNPLGLEIEALGATAQGKNLYHVDVLVKLPFENLLLLPRGERFVGNLTLFVVVRDDQSQDLSTLRELEVPLDVTAEQLAELRRQTAIYPLKLEMKGGKQRLAIGLRDHLAQTSASVEIDLDVQSLTPTPPAAGPTQGAP